ncbi:MAG: macrolide family glycosyltransferase [Kineosporiaceae bacterium]
MTSRLDILVTPVPWAGHVNPTLAVTKELVRRGHRVTYALPEQWRPVVRAVGATLLPIAPVDSLDDPAEDALTRFALTPPRLTRHAVSVLPQILSQVTVRTPDLLAYDVLCVWGRLLATVLPSPAAVLHTTFATNEHVSYVDPALHYRGLGDRLASAMAGYSADIATLSRAHGTPRVTVQDLLSPREAVEIVFCLPSYQPAVATFGERHRFVGPSLRPAAAGPPGGNPFPGALDAARRHPRSLFVSGGTRNPEWPGLVELCAEAFGDGRWEVAVAAPPPARPVDVPTLHVRDTFPQVEILRQAAGLVTHGGMNSLMEAAVHGVPVLVVPRVPEQAVNAATIAGLGVGLTADPATLTPQSLRAAVDCLVEDQAIQRAVAEMRLQAVAAGGPGAAADALEDRVAAGGVQA